MSNILALSAFKGTPLPKIEILNGKKMQARPGYDKTLLLGNCIIAANKDNKNIQDAIAVKGCPPSEKDVAEAMKTAGLDVNTDVYYGYMKQQSEKYDGKEGFDREFFRA
jgi:coenzyme F420-reducing hydrogenase gamma subunit